MSTAKRRSTFWGPQRAYENPSAGSRYRVQLHNLLPGEHWNPALEDQLLAPHDLVINVDNQIWTVWDDPFFFRFDQNFKFKKNQLFVKFSPENATAFLFHFWFCVHGFMYNEILTAPGNYAYSGSATISHWEVPV